jgi:hypothetical protein
MPSTLLWRTARFLNRNALSRLGLQVVRPNVLHGPPAYTGVVEWSRRLWGFERLANLVADVPGGFVECGVFYGYGILVMLHATATHTLPRHISGFDSFAGHPPQATADASTPEAEALGDFWRVTPEDVWRTLTLGTDLGEAEIRAKVTLFPGWFSDTMPAFQGPIAFMHLDPDYYQSTKDALAHLWPRVSPGGIVLFGQFENRSLPGKGIAIREFLASTPPDQVALEHDIASGHHFLRKLK